MRHAAPWLVALLTASGLAACGKKGPPLPPLHLVPAAVTDVKARRVADLVTIEFVLPTRNANGAGPIGLDRVEVYAATVAPDGVVPTDGELLRSSSIVGTIAVKPPPVDGAPAPEGATEDRRPAPGEKTTFAEQLDEAARRPFARAASESRPAGGCGAPGAKPEAAGAPPEKVDFPVRVYVLRGRTKSGRAGEPTARLRVPLVPAPAPPLRVDASFDARAIALSWTPPAAEPGGRAPAFNVYAPGASVPLNPEPIAGASFEQPLAGFGTELCFTVRTVETVAGVPIEGIESDRACVTPVDRFPPAAPTGLAAVASEGTISLIWDANAEPDVAGYLILRGEAPGDTLQPLTPEPIRDAKFADTTVKPGVRYVYAVVAVDSAAPPNRSAPSARVEETAR